MKFSSALISVAAIASAANAFVFPVSPIGSTIWKPADQVQISWTNDATAPSLATNPVFDIYLMTGSDTNQTQLAVIAANVTGEAAGGNVTYTVPYVSPPGQIYFLKFQTTAGVMAWATRFTITDATGNTGTLKPTPPSAGGVNPGGEGTIIPAPTTASTTGGSSTKDPSATAAGATPTKTSGAGSLAASALFSGAAAIVLGAAALVL